MLKDRQESRFVCTSNEHVAVLENPDQFDFLHRKNDFLAEGVHTVFGVKDGEAQLQAFYFPEDQFTPPASTEWLQERGFEPLVFTEATESRDSFLTHVQGKPWHSNNYRKGRSSNAMKTSSFADVKHGLEEACEFLRSFTLGRHGFTQQDGIAGIQRVTDRCNRMEKLFADGPDANESKAVVASKRPQVLAAQARLALLRKDQ